jgi:hypothetical protein
MGRSWTVCWLSLSGCGLLDGTPAGGDPAARFGLPSETPTTESTTGITTESTTGITTESTTGTTTESTTGTTTESTTGGGTTDTTTGGTTTETTTGGTTTETTTGTTTETTTGTTTETTTGTTTETTTGTTTETGTGTGTGTTTTDTGTPTTETIDTGVDGVSGWMTGGGSIGTGNDKVHHGFNLSCTLPPHHENLEINWGQGTKFKLTELTSVLCWDDPAIAPAPPDAPFDTLSAVGVGELDGVPGSTVEITFTDAGEPGNKGDWAILRIDGGAALDVSAEVQGNHQAHGDGDEEEDTGTGAGGGSGASASSSSTSRVVAPLRSLGCDSTSGAPLGGLGILVVALTALRRRR